MSSSSETCRHNEPYSSHRTPIIAAATALVVVHGLGRFAYTPLLPLLVDDGVLSLTQAADLASANYVGYLLGALLALWLFRVERCRQGLIWALLGNALLTLSQVVTADVSSLMLSRLLNGVSNGVVFVLAPALVLEWLAARRATHLSGWMYIGVGVGILLSDALVESSVHLLHGNARWWPMGLASIPLSIAAIMVLRHLPEHKKHANDDDHSPLWDRASTPLFLAYAGAGLGYILPLTFLPAVASTWAVVMHPSAWLVVALASIPSIFLWNTLGTKLNDQRALLLNYAVQALSLICLLLLPPSSVALWLCALLMGGSFLGAVLLTQRLARTLHPHQGPRLSAALIALYGFTQLIGPWLVARAMEQGLSLSASFGFGLAALIWALVCMMFVPAHKAAA